MKIELVDFLDLFNRDIQYSVPRWQRRYRWGKSTIQQLIKDLVTISGVKHTDARHFGGTLITYSGDAELGRARIEHVVDGQQRLTTISILLICIAERLQKTGDTEQWDSKRIRDAYLNNRLEPQAKLLLQNEDDIEYKRILGGRFGTGGKIVEAWQILRKEVDSNEVDLLMKGLSRFRVIHFKCDPYDDPQQIFESLNATGVPLTEGEKIKNWLLMGLDHEIQEELYQTHWRKIEKCLKREKSDQIDEFLRDFLRWKTGENWGKDKIYENLRRWWYKSEGKNRTDLCAEFARLAELYGTISGINEQHENAEINRLLRHLQTLGLDVHRPFTLRLLDDATKPNATGAYEEEIIKTLITLNIWLTRIWLAGNAPRGLNSNFAGFAHQKATLCESYADFWREEIRKLRHTHSGVPNAEEIRAGIKKKKVGGGKKSDIAKAILFAMNSHLEDEKYQRIEDLSLERIMPKKINDSWRLYLGEVAEEIHASYVDSLVNLSLVEKGFSLGVSSHVYAKKHDYYLNSNVRLTRELARKHENWWEEDMDARSQELTELALESWPWENITRAKVRWRISGGDWEEEKKYSEMHLNVVAELLDCDPEGNSELLLGNHIYLSGMEPTSSGTRYRRIPRHEDYVANLNYSSDAIFKRCTEMAERCGETIEFESRNKQRDIWEAIHPYPTRSDRHPRWRINGGVWNTEKSNASMLLNVVGSLLDSNLERNSERLLGDRMSRDIFLSGEEPEGAYFRPIPRYRQYVINLRLGRNAILKLCREMGDRCGVSVEAE